MTPRAKPYCKMCGHPLHVKAYCTVQISGKRDLSKAERKTVTAKIRLCSCNYRLNDALIEEDPLW